MGKPARALNLPFFDTYKDNCASSSHSSDDTGRQGIRHHCMFKETPLKLSAITIVLEMLARWSKIIVPKKLPLS